MTKNERPIPESVPCVCGSGEAKRKAVAPTEPSPKGGHARTVFYHYRHRGCPYGGTIVVDGEDQRRVGPVFDPVRYGIGNVPAAREVASGD